MSRRDQFAQVLVPLGVLYQEEQMGYHCLVSRVLGKARCGRHIDFATYDGLYACRICLLIELYSTIHGAMVSDGQGGHPIGCCSLQQRLNANCPVKEAILGVDMEMDETRSGHQSNR